MSEGEKHQYFEYIIRLGISAFPDIDESDTLVVGRKLLNQVIEPVFEAADMLRSKDASYILHQVVRFLIADGKYQGVDRLLALSIDIDKSLLGEKHHKATFAMNNLAISYENQGRFVEAADLHYKVLQLMKETFGEEHPVTLESKNNVASVLKALGDLPKH